MEARIPLPLGLRRQDFGRGDGLVPSVEEQCLRCGEGPAGGAALGEEEWEPHEPLWVTKVGSGARWTGWVGKGSSQN